MSKQKKVRTKGSSKSKPELGSFEKEAVERLKNGEGFGGKDGILAPMIKRILDAILEAELDIHLNNERGSGKKNRKNGRQGKGLKTRYGTIELEGGRYHGGTFEPGEVSKRQTTLGAGLDEKIIPMYSRGMSYSDITSHPEGLYGLEMSKTQPDSG